MAPEWLIDIFVLEKHPDGTGKTCPDGVIDAPFRIQADDFAEIVLEQAARGVWRGLAAFLGLKGVESDPKKDEASIVIIAASFRPGQPTEPAVHT